jgi:hypothetical protein
MLLTHAASHGVDASLTVVLLSEDDKFYQFEIKCDLCDWWDHWDERKTTVAVQGFKDLAASGDLDEEFKCTYFETAEWTDLPIVCGAPPVEFGDGYVTCRTGHKVPLEGR